MKQRYLLTLAPLAALAFALAGCGGSGSVPSNAVAVVEKCNTPVTKNDFNQVLNQARVNYQHNKQPFPGAGTPEYRQIQDQVVSYLVTRDAYICEAKDMGVAPSSKDVDTRVNQLVQQYYKGDQTKYKEALKQQGVSEEQLRQEVAMQLAQKNIFDKVTANANTNVTDQELHDYYNKNKQQYQTPATRTVRHILVKSKSLADQIETKLKNGASFAALAEKYSQDPGSKKVGGKLTDLAQGQTVAPFDHVAFTLKTGQISAPVHSQFGWHIIQALTPIKPKTVTSFDSVKAQIKQIVAQSNKTKVGQTWADNFRKDLAKSSAVKYQAGYQPAPTTTGATSTTTG